MQDEDKGIMQADHQRTVVWTFEDLHMLIGTDLPIFGGNTHPCVSLRLRYVFLLLSLSNICHSCKKALIDKMATLAASL